MLRPESLLQNRLIQQQTCRPKEKNRETTSPRYGLSACSLSLLSESGADVFFCHIRLCDVMPLARRMSGGLRDYLDHLSVPGGRIEGDKLPIHARTRPFISEV